MEYLTTTLNRLATTTVKFAGASLHFWTTPMALGFSPWVALGLDTGMTTWALAFGDWVGQPDDLTSSECMATWDEVEVLSATTSHARDKQKEKDFDPLETLLQGKKILRLKISRYYSDPHSPEPQDRSCKSKIANNSDYCHYRVRGRCTTSMRVTRRRHVALRTGYLASLRWSVTIGKRVLMHVHRDGRILRVLV